MLFGIKFREKGSKEYKSVIITAKNEAEMNDIFKVDYLNDEFLDIDKRTISWAGDSIPLTHKTSVMISGNLDNLM